MTDRIREKAAIDKALAVVFKWAEGRLVVDHREFIIWRQMVADAAQQVIEELQDADVALIPMGVYVPLRVEIRDDERRFKRTTRVEADLGSVGRLGIKHETDAMLIDPRMAEHVAVQSGRMLAAKVEEYLREPMAVAVMTGADWGREQSR